jgi:bifunctional enzyme CysN/CysC
MASTDAARDPAIDAFLRRQEGLDVLHLLTCGSVDDGKSTLIGRLLYDSKSLLEDQLAALKEDSAKTGRGTLDFSLLLDGLRAEREQGITIDVAYRFFATGRRRFVVADCPGHEHYTRNMATGASTSDLAILLVDATQGVLTQTMRHATIASLLGISQVVLAVNKMDLVGYAEPVFAAIVGDFERFAARLGRRPAVTAIPLSALYGDNVVAAGEAMPWYRGPPLLSFLETVEVRNLAAEGPFRLPVQWVCRADGGFRGYSGLIVGGQVRPGDEITVQPSGQRNVVERIVTSEGERPQAVAGQSVMLTLRQAADISRGDLLAAADRPAVQADQFAAHLLWMDKSPMLPGRRYILRAGTQSVGAQVTEIKHKVDVDTLAHLAGKKLEMNELAVCNLSLDHELPFDPYADNRDTGSFILVDRATNATCGCGMIDFALYRADNVHWQKLEVNKAAHTALKGQKPCVLWLTGLSGAGKSTIANLAEKRLHAQGRHTVMLDGDNLRHGLNRDLGFTAEDRVENVRRTAEVARLMVEAGLIVLVSLISPFRSERRMARELFAEGEFLEIYVSTPLAECERRDVKGLYRKARQGQIANFTGISSPYEPPENADLVLDGGALAPEQAAERLIDLLARRDIIPRRR